MRWGEKIERLSFLLASLPPPLTINPDPLLLGTFKTGYNEWLQVTLALDLDDLSKKKKQTLNGSDFQTFLQDYNISITILARKTHNMRSENA